MARMARAGMRTYGGIEDCVADSGGNRSIEGASADGAVFRIVDHRNVDLAWRRYVEGR